MWINKIKKLLDIFLPSNCLGCGKSGELICPTCLSEIILTGQYLPSFGNLKKIITVLDYDQPLIKKAIRSFKYPPFNQNILNYLIPFLIEFLRYSPTTIDYLKKNNFVLIPIPLTKRKLAQRGFNQSELIAKEIATEFNLNLNTKILKKIKNTRSQTNLSPEERKNNVKNVFRIKADCPTNLVLVDDILTTGATLAEAAKSLHQAGAKEIWGIVLMRG
ncbi:MAG: ComF family protein [Patescibacteria group bacterium]|jgi:ComF family protein|nr:ComF family protein [Patescibacteria group bacterium]MDD5172833.1 ComF family protein [Patescibacteria group bacterium]